MAIDLNKVRLNAVDLTDALRGDWVRIGRPLTPEERAGIHAHMRWCLGELTGLVRELEAEDAAPTPRREAPRNVIGLRLVLPHG